MAPNGGIKTACTHIFLKKKQATATYRFPVLFTFLLISNIVGISLCLFAFCFAETAAVSLNKQLLTCMHVLRPLSLVLLLLLLHQTGAFRRKFDCLYTYQLQITWAIFNSFELLMNLAYSRQTSRRLTRKINCPVLRVVYYKWAVGGGRLRPFGEQRETRFKKCHRLFHVLKESL
jgi:hypothetical protein